MEIQQTIVEDIEKLITTGNAINTAVDQMKEFLSVPHSKLEITEYIRLYVAEKMFLNKDFRPIIVKLIPSSTLYNSRLLSETLEYEGKGNFTIGKNFYIQYRKVIDDILKYMLLLDEGIKQLTYDDIVERNIALRRAYLKLIIILNETFRVPVDVTEFPEMQFEEHNISNYMTLPLSSLQERVEGSLWAVSDIDNMYCWGDGSFCQNNSTNTLKTLMNFVIYLGSFVRY